MHHLVRDVRTAAIRKRGLASTSSFPAANLSDLQRIHSVEMKEWCPVKSVLLDDVPIHPFGPNVHYIYLNKLPIYGNRPYRLKVVVDSDAVGPLWIQLLGGKEEVECTSPQPVPAPSFQYLR